jgi:hypothetical protein
MSVHVAYWDESGVNKGDPWLTVAGLILATDLWSDFSARWMRVLEEFEVSASTLGHCPR